MKRALSRSVASITAICCIFAAYSDSRAAGTATNLLTICTSAHATTQASKCTAWQYNVYSPSAYIESYPQVSPGPKVWTDPAYEYRLGSTITGVMGVKVCPTPLVPGTSFYSPQADPCPNNVLVAASSVIYTAQANTPVLSLATGTYGPRVITSVGLSGQQNVAVTDTTPAPTIYYTTDGSVPSLFSNQYSVPILLPPGVKTTIQAIAYAPTASAPSNVATGVYTVPLFPSDSFPEPIPNLLTVCTSATTTTQAAKCEGWQYNFFSPAAYLESYPQVNPGPKGFTDPQYEYRLGSSLIPTNGVKVCPSKMLPGVSFSSTAADVCPTNVLDSASSVIPAQNLPDSIFLFNTNLNNVQTSCQYYQAIGAIKSAVSSPCALNPDGSFVNAAFNKATWLANNYNTVAGGTENTATFVNITDLNFVRVHHATVGTGTNGGTRSAAYVCNYAGPDFYHSAIGESGAVDQNAVNAAIQNAMSNLNPLPCVAFDYGDPSVATLNSGQPFIRMLVFNPAGNLAAAVDLDGRGPKQVPNACSACHGVPYGETPPTGYPQPEGQVSYIPFDEGNLLFSTVSGPTPTVREAQIKALNMIVLNGAGAVTTALSELINGWYANGSATQKLYAPPGLLNPTLVPDPPQTALNAYGVYLDIYAPFCRSCHVANHAGYDPPENDAQMFSLFNTANVCSPNPASNTVMPNSKVAFDRFWTTHAAGLTTYSAMDDLAALLQTYINNNPNQPAPPTPPINCSLSQFPSFN
jgi:hypothetical protein